MTNCYKFSHVFYNHLNPNVSSNSLSYTFISHRWFSSRMSPPTDRGTSRSSSVGKLAGCLFQSIIKLILIFSPLINTLFFTTYQITLCVLQMLIIYFLPWIDHTFSITSVAYNWFSISFFSTDKSMGKFTPLSPRICQVNPCRSLWFTLKLSPQIDKIVICLLLMISNFTIIWQPMHQMEDVTKT